MYKILNVTGENAIFFGRRPTDLLENQHPRRLASNTNPPYRFAHARTALKYGLKSIGCGRGDVILIPDLICVSLVEPLAELGIEPSYYPVDQKLEPDWHRLGQLLTNSTKALLVVHYFGQPQPIQKCIEFCNQHSLLLIEDNAHGFGGTLDGQLLGTLGAIGVSAPRKSFPISNGAFLYMAKEYPTDLSSLQLQPASTSPFKERCKHWLKMVPAGKAVIRRRRNIAEYRRRTGPCPRYDSQDAFRDPPLCHDYGMDQSVESFLEQQDLKQIRKVRQQIYNLWQQWAEGQGLTPVFPSLSPGAMPLVFPAYTQSTTLSRNWHERGHRTGIDIHSWPTLPQAIVSRNSNAMRLWERMLCFPIHQEMDIQSLKRRLAVL